MKNEVTITREQFFEFIKSKEETEENSSPKYFLDYFDSYQKTGKKTSWNWAAFFFNGLWFLHRKMYFYWALILLYDAVLVFDVGIGSFLSNLGVDRVLKITPSVVFMVISVSLHIFLLRYSNYIYLRYANKKIRGGTLNRGTNMWVVWVLVLVFLIKICIPEPIFLVIKGKLLDTLNLA
ncbi:MAG: DUF2628 domain-containing protein [Proteobacteria bacterium]|nr:DUF2628 domain-containing protein [Pseudomonadota bacterium]